jgi:phage-related holin
MKSILSIFQHKYLLLSAFAYGWFEVVAIPQPMLMVFLFGAITFDFITGIIKSMNKGVIATSVGFRKTVTKIGGYSGTIIAMWILANMLGMMNKGNKDAMDYSFLVNGTIGFITFIEIYSILENVSELFPNKSLIRGFLNTIMKFLKNKIESENPIKQLEDEQESNK